MSVEGALPNRLLVFFGAGFVDAFADAEAPGQLLNQLGSLMSRMACSSINKLRPRYGLTMGESMTCILVMALTRAPKYIEEHSNEHD